MKKASLLSSLFKLKKEDKLADFFQYCQQASLSRSRDFNEEKNRTAAVKNAFVLLSRKDYLKAACFLLVAGKLEECLNVLVKVRLRDVG